ncbi:MAG TPA: hypothetical protein VFE46_07405 [Pirellulales bacterium]|jgi:hypothetical protein|nr:hypothetical protein [Pirellulales bacterium]
MAMILFGSWQLIAAKQFTAGNLLAGAVQCATGSISETPIRVNVGAIAKRLVLTVFGPYRRFSIGIH